MLRALDLLGRSGLYPHTPSASASSSSSSSLTPPPPITSDRSTLPTPPASVPSKSEAKVLQRAKVIDHDIPRRTSSRRRKGIKEPPLTPETPTLPRRRGQRRKNAVDDDNGTETYRRDRPKRLGRVPVVEIETLRRRSVKRDANMDTAEPSVLATSETSSSEPPGKILLIQERVRHDPWRMLIATCLLNVTSGRAARPIYVELLRRYPTVQALAQASIPDLSELLYPLGLFNQRASTLVRFSNQYLQLGWPIYPATDPDPFVSPTQPIPTIKAERKSSQDFDLDVHVFHGAGRYASDSFRIFSDLFPGKGAPQREKIWLEKRDRAINRTRKKQEDDHCSKEGVEVKAQEGNWDPGELGEYLSEADEVEDEEWRKVRPNDKPLRLYLKWRWGLEGIAYDIHTGPVIVRERDQRRLSHLLAS